MLYNPTYLIKSRHNIYYFRYPLPVEHDGGAQRVSISLAIAEELGLETLSSTTTNKHLGYFSALFEWAKRNKLIQENPFKGIKVKAKKKDNRRDMFNKDEIATILQELESNSLETIKSKSQYWGTLIAIYTGARRNEIECYITLLIPAQ